MMRWLVPIIASLFILLATGCISIQQKILADLSKITVPDIQQAIMMAQASKDPDALAAVECYQTLLKYAAPDAASLLPGLQAWGVISALEAAREARSGNGVGLSGLVPRDVRVKCSFLILDAEEFAIKTGLSFAPLPGLQGIR